MTESDHRRSKIKRAICALLLALFVVCVLWLVLLPFSKAGAPLPEYWGAVGLKRDVSPPTTPLGDRQGGETSIRAGETRSPGNNGEVPVPENAGGPTSQYQRPPAIQTVTLMFQDQRGAAVPNLPIQYGFASHNDVRQQKKRVERNAGVVPAFVGAPASTDLSGEVQLQWDASLTALPWLVVAPQDASRWQFRAVEPSAVPKGRLWGAGAWARTMSPMKWRYTIRVLPVSTVAIQVRFSDGAPFAGRVQLGLRGKTSSDYSTIWHDVNGVTEVLFRVVPMDGVVSVMVECTAARAGFKGRHIVEGDVAWLENSPVVEVPAISSQLQAGLAVDLSGYYAKDGWKFTLYERLRPAPPIGILTWGLEFRTVELRVGVPYFVRLEGPDGQVWQSATIDPIAGEVISLVPSVSVGAQVRLRAVDAESNVLSPSYATLHAERGPNWRIARDRVGKQFAGTGQVYSDKDGVLVLDGVPLDSTTLYVEAEGYGRVEVPLRLQAGTTLEIGDVVLATPAGRITVKLAGYPANQEFRLRLTSVSGEEVRTEIVKPGQTEITVEGLPFRSYLVMICRVSEKSLLTIDAPRDPVELSVANPTAEFESDYSKPMFPRNRKD